MSKSSGAKASFETEATSAGKRTHAQMRREMRFRLIGATITTLVDRGYSATSVQNICEEAGVSKGALFRHFPTRLSLLVATGRYAYQQLVGEFAEDFKSIQTGEKFARDLLVLMRNSSSTELQLAGNELQLASRTDNALADALQPINASYGRGVNRLAAQIFPSAAKQNPNFAAAVDVIRLTLLGENAIFPITSIDGEALEARMAFLLEIAEREILSYEGSETQSD